MLTGKDYLRALFLGGVAGGTLYVLFQFRPHVGPLSIIMGVSVGGRYLLWALRRARRARAAATTPPAG